jgi:cytochrome b involved in lipid metabolism
MAPRPEEQSIRVDEQADGATQPVKETLLLKEDIVQIDGVLYDAAGMASIHPGGELFVKSFSGRDATEAFLSYHRCAK